MARIVIYRGVKTRLVEVSEIDEPDLKYYIYGSKEVKRLEEDPAAVLAAGVVYNALKGGE